MEFLIDDLLNYSRIGKSAVHNEIVSMDRLLQSMKLTFADRLNEKGGTLTIMKDVPDIRTDKSLVTQIFTNLIDNALKFTSPKTPPQIKIDWQSGENDIFFQITDNGIGIPPEHHEKIFQIFQRLHNQDEYPGTGIGLATVQKSLNLLEGSIIVASEVGKGSTFSLRVPKSGFHQN